MKERVITEFSYACKAYLSSLSLGKLRVYGREVGVANPTEKRKEELIEAIVNLHTGVAMPVERSKKGAPVKEDYVDPKIALEIREIYEKVASKYLPQTESEEEEISPEVLANSKMAQEKRMREFLARGKTPLRVEDPEAAAHDIHNIVSREVLKGQLQTVDGVSWLLPLNCFGEEKIIVPVECIRANDLREGDVVTCHAEKGRTSLVAREILTINGLVKNSFHRGKFNEMEACYPNKRLRVYNGENDSLTAKYFDWLTPVGKGQRAAIVAPPKSGKTEVLFGLAKGIYNSSPETTLLVLLVEQAPETVARFRKIVNNENLIYTTYEDSPERQTFAANFLMNRAKRFAECGKDVVLLVDSLSALAKAFNETEESSGGKTLLYGLESKTLHYIKQYFGAARCLEKGGSLTVVGSVLTGTGSPVDDLIASDLLNVGNLEIPLSERLAGQKIFPAIDLLKVKAVESERFKTEEEMERFLFVRNQFLPKYGEKELLEMLQNAKDSKEFSIKLNER